MDDIYQPSSSINPNVAETSLGLEELSPGLLDVEYNYEDEGYVNESEEEQDGEDRFEGGVMEADGNGTEEEEEEEERIYVDGVEDILKMNINSVSPRQIRNIKFANVEVAFQFYNMYGKVNGFSARKNKNKKNKNGEIVQQTFVCHRQGFRENRGLTMENRKREPKPETRCGCEAKFRVHIDRLSGRWYVRCFMDEHNHELLSHKYCGMLPAHRKLTNADIMQMNNLRKVGISTPHIYCSFASQSGGYEKIGFRKKDIYNEIGRQRRLQSGDAKGAIAYLDGLSSNDPMMYWRHTVDEEGRMQHLFWCDAISQIDYQLFGDVLAFDATYRKNKYMCPLVVFSGVNHHNQTIIFAAAIVANELDETYVWLLEQFTEAMKGKSPSSVITDGDLAMRHAIRRVFPSAHHRLCAWHLLRNATSNIKIPAFTEQFKKCMLTDYDVGEFEHKWTKMVTKFGLEDHPWVKDIYEKRKMWATAHIRGSFFAGFRTTSRCEALHSQIGKFVHSRNSLTDFLQHFYRCLNFIRYKEVELDFASIVSEPVVQTSLRSMERSAAKHYTREVFHLFRPMLTRASLMIVVGCKQTVACSIYTVSKYRTVGKEWLVSFYPQTVEFKCSCQRMESFGLPCDHLVAIMVYLHFAELPKSLVLPRWTKLAKELLQGNCGVESNTWNTNLDARYGWLVYRFKDLCIEACPSIEDCNDINEMITRKLESIRARKAHEGNGVNVITQSNNENLRDPDVVRSKGCGPSSLVGGKKTKRVMRCSNCKQPGHNRKCCPDERRNIEQTQAPLHGTPMSLDEEEDVNFRDTEVSTDLLN